MSQWKLWKLVLLLVVATSVVLAAWEVVLLLGEVRVPAEQAWLLRFRAVTAGAVLAAVAGWYTARLGRVHGQLLELRRVEAQLDCAPNTVVRLDRNGHITHVNEAWRRFARANGADERTVAGVGLDYLAVLRGGDATELGAVAAGLDEVLAGRMPTYGWSYACHAPTELRWFSAEARRLDDDDAVVMVHTEVTGAQLSRGRERVHAELAQAAVLRAPLDEAAAVLARTLGSELEWPLVALWLPDANAPGVLCCADAWSSDPRFEALRAEKRGSTPVPPSALFGASTVPRAPEWLELDANAPPPCAAAAAAARAGLRSRVAFAISVGVEPVAVVELYCEVQRRFDMAVNGLITFAALQLGASEGQQRAEAAAARAARRHALLFEASRDALMTLAPPTWKFTSGNAACVKLFGAKDEADFVARGPWEFSPEQQPDGSSSADGAKASIEAAMREGSHLFQWTHQTLDGRLFPATVLLSRVDLEGESFLQATVRDESTLAKARADEAATRSLLDSIVSCAPVVLVTTDRQGVVTFINQPGANGRAMVGQSWLAHVPPEEQDGYRARLARVLATGKSEIYEARGRGAADGKGVDYSVHIGPLRRGDTIEGLVIAALDVTELRRSQAEATAGQRLAAIGTLAAGVAHEINTPVQFVSDSMQFLSDACRDLFGVVFAEREVSRLAATGATPEALERALAAAQEAAAEADLDYLQEQMPKAFERCGDGLQRIATIVRSMKEFAHPAQTVMAPADLNRAIASTLTIAKSEYKYVAELETELQPLPPVTCFLADLNQVILNLVVNAAHAIGEVVGTSGERGRIRVATRQEGDEVVIEIGDTGAGIPDAIRARIFEPFFTTKAVGKGTGQGLALAWSVVREKHGGALRFDSTVGKGTTFTIRLPIAGKPSSKAAPALEAGASSSAQAA